MSQITHKVIRALNTLAWSNLAYESASCFDCDDYAQTVLLMASLAKNEGFNEKHFVKMLREPNMIMWRNQLLAPSGLPHGHRTGQIYKLLSNNDPNYMAIDGITDGAAMRTLGLAAFYNKLDDLAYYTDLSSKVTHAEIEARASAVVVAYRYAQIFFGRGTMDDLIGNLAYAFKKLRYGERGKFVLEMCKKASGCIRKSPEETLIKLMKHVGLLHLGFSTPISAVAFSYVGTAAQKKILKTCNLYSLNINDLNYDGTHLSDEAHRLMVDHLEKYDQLEQHDRDYFANDESVGTKPRRIDADTFFAIAFSLIAADNPDFLSQEELSLVKESCNSSRQLVEMLMYKKSLAFPVS